jgi:hypothetical protein
MTLNTTGYTVATNQPLNHARILWDMLDGTVTGDGTNPAFAANDYTSQRWELAAGANDWTLTMGAAADLDTVFISAHNLAGRTVIISTSPDLVTAYTTRATIVADDNSTIAALFNQGNGEPVSAQRIKINVSEGTGNVVGIIRAGKALQMQRPFYGGYAPIRLNRVTEGQQSFSETGQWLGRTEKRRALSTTYNWQHLTADWYRANFEPFAETLPLKPFGIVGNPSRMSEDVGWAWTQEDPAPSNMGIRDLMQVSLNVTGYWS